MSQEFQSPQPIVFDANLYIDGLKALWSGSNLITVTPGSCRNSENDYDMVVTNNLTVPGKFSLDTGSYTVSTSYALYLIGNKFDVNAPALILSKSFVQPVLPFGYNTFRRIGSIASNVGNAFENFAQYGDSNERIVRYHDEYNNLYILQTGVATTPTTISCAPFVPPSSQLAMFQTVYTSSSAGTFFKLGPGGNNITNPFIVVCAITGRPIFTTYTDFECPNSQVIYSVSGTDNVSISVMGYKEYV